jgi:ATP-dependent Lon protease
MSSPAIPEEISRALDALPLFPLHDGVMFPGMAVPLHVFEPRYRALIRDVLADHRCFSIVRVADPAADLAGNPAICSVACLGTITAHEELPDGRFHLLLVGRARVRLEELPFEPPYRRARATLLDTPEREVPRGELAALHSAVATFLRSARERDPSYDPTLPEGAPLGTYCDACAARMLLPSAARQRILEAVDICERVSALTEALTMQQHGFVRAGSALN